MQVSDAECQEIVANRNFQRVFDYYEEHPAIDYDIQAVHKAGIILICGASCIFNALLFYVIRTQSESVKSVKGLIMFSCVYDFCYSLFSLQMGSLPSTFLGLAWNLDNQIIRISNYEVMAVLKAFNSTGFLGAWMTVPIQFLWRFHIFKYGRRPQGVYLYAIAIPTALILITFFITTHQVYGNNPDDERELMRKIAYYNGFKDVLLSEVTGTYTNTRGYFLSNSIIKLVLYGSYCISLIVDLAMLYLWRRQRSLANNRTKKLFYGVRNTLRIMAMGPLITAVLPVYVIRMFGSGCEFHPWAVILGSWPVVFQCLLNALTTIYFIHPYRRFVISLGRPKPSTTMFEVSSRTK